MEVLWLAERMSEANAIAERFVEQLPKIPKASLDEADQHCSICQEDFESQTSNSQSEHAVKLRCTHVFGSECIKTWVRSHNSCPVCRQSIDERFSHDQYESGEEDEDEDDDDDEDHWMRRSHEVYLAGMLRDHLQRLLYRTAAEMAFMDPEEFSRQANNPPGDPWVRQGWELARATVARERLLYQEFREDILGVPALQDPNLDETNILEWLFIALESRGVFDRSWSGFTPLADHEEMFLILRQAGFVWDMNYTVHGREERGAWVGLCMSVAGTARVAVQ